MALCPHPELCSHLKLAQVLKPRSAWESALGTHFLSPLVSQDPISLSGTPRAFLSEWSLWCILSSILCNLCHAQFRGEHLTFWTAIQFSCEPFHSKWACVFPTDWKSHLCPDLIDHISHSVQIWMDLSSSPGVWKHLSRCEPRGELQFAGSSTPEFDCILFSSQTL